MLLQPLNKCWKFGHGDIAMFEYREIGTWLYINIPILLNSYFQFSFRSGIC